MIEQLESSSSIRRALGPVLGTISAFSDMSSERKETARLRKILLRDCPNYCATCGVEFNENIKLEAAHILSLAEGGITCLENLVGLCTDCHRKYDVGCASTSEVEKAAEAWRKGLLHNPLGDKSLDRADALSAEPVHLCLGPLMGIRANFKASPIFRPRLAVGLERVHEFLRLRASVKALHEARQVRPHLPPGSAQSVATLLMAQIERRRSAAGSLARAKAILVSVNPKGLSTDLLPLYYYELGFVFQMLGQHQESADAFRRSYQAAADLNDEYSPQDMAVALHRMYAVETIREPHERKPRAEVDKRCAEFDELVRQAATFPRPWAGRWKHNILGWTWRYCYKCSEPEDANRVFTEYEEFRRNHDLTNGYFRESESRICGYKAMMMLLKPCSKEELNLAVKLVCRSLVSLLGFRVRPEGIRDFLMTLEIALGRLDQTLHNSDIQRLTEVREAVVDGSSFLDPYKDSGTLQARP